MRCAVIIKKTENCYSQSSVPFQLSLPSIQSDMKKSLTNRSLCTVDSGGFGGGEGVGEAPLLNVQNQACYLSSLLLVCCNVTCHCVEL